MQAGDVPQLQLGDTVLYRGQPARIRRRFTSMDFNRSVFRAHFDLEQDGAEVPNVDYRELQLQPLELPQAA